MRSRVHAHGGSTRLANTQATLLHPTSKINSGVRATCAHVCATRLASPRAMLLRPSLETVSAPMYRPKNASVNCFESTTPACMALR